MLMPLDKRIVVKYRPADLVLEGAGIALAIAVLIVAATLYPDCAERSALLWPIAAVYIYLVLTGAGLIARRLPISDGRNGRKLRFALTLTLSAKAAAMAFALIGTYAAMTAQGG